MADEQVLTTVRNYLGRLWSDFGLDARAAVLFGSWARDRADPWSDIDIVVLADRFDAGITREDIRLLWWAAATTDSRIEPVPCGERQWRDDDKSAVIEMARREGQVILREAA